MPLYRGCSRTTESANFHKLYAENAKLPPRKRRSRAQITAIVLAQARRTGAGRKCQPGPNPNQRASGVMGPSLHISTTRAASIRRRIQAYESAREKFDPKRFKRGGGYSPADVRAIEQLAGVRNVTNDERAMLENYNWYVNPPSEAFVYYSDDMRTVRGFMGNVMGHITRRGTEVRRMGTKTVSIQVRGTNGIDYFGNCNLESGTYCRLRRRAG